MGWLAAAWACVASWGPASPATTIIIQPSPGNYESVILDTTTPKNSFDVHDRFLTHDTIMGTDVFKESDLLGFSLGTIPVGHVLSAELVLYHAENAVPANTVFNIYQNTSTWSSATVTYQSLPSFTAAPLSSISLGGSPGQSYSFDVTAAVNSWLGGAANDGFTIQRDGGANPVAAFDSGLAGNPAGRMPALVITFAPVPEPSSLLLIAAGSAGLLLHARSRALRSGPS
jgi:hypothetical protein